MNIYKLSTQIKFHPYNEYHPDHNPVSLRGLIHFDYIRDIFNFHDKAMLTKAFEYITYAFIPRIVEC